MKATNKVLVSVALVVLVGIAAGAGVNLNGAIVNAFTGFKFNGAAPLNHVLCGNGTLYVDAAACGTVAVPFYQTIDSQSVALPQRFVTNYTSNFTLADESGDATLIELASNITSNAATATALATAPNPCTPPLFAGGIDVHGNSINCGGVTGTISDLTTLRSFGNAFTNSHTTAIYVSGFGTTSSSGDTSQISCSVNGMLVWVQQANATLAGHGVGFTMMVPPGAIYRCDVLGSTAVTLGGWTEFVF